MFVRPTSGDSRSSSTLAIWPRNTPDRLAVLRRPLGLLPPHASATTCKNNSPWKRTCGRAGTDVPFENTVSGATGAESRIIQWSVVGGRHAEITSFGRVILGNPVSDKRASRKLGFLERLS